MYDGALTFLKNLFASAERAESERVTAPPAPGITRTPTREVIFTGRTRIQTKRRMIRYWSEHHSALDMGLDEFSRCCTLLEDERTIVFHGREAA